MNEQIRGLFPALEHSTYLNSAAVSPLPRTAINAVNRQLMDVATYGSAHYPEWVETKNRTRALVAEMLAHPGREQRWDYGGMPVPMDGMPIVLRPLR